MSYGQGYCSRHLPFDPFAGCELVLFGMAKATRILLLGNRFHWYPRSGSLRTVRCLAVIVTPVSRPIVLVVPRPSSGGN